MLRRLNRRRFRRLVYRSQAQVQAWVTQLGFLTRTPRRRAVFIMALVVVAGLVSWLTTPRHTPAPSPTTSSHAVTVSTDHPDETKPTAYRSTATGSEPKYIRLPSLNAEGYIQKVGVDQSNRIAVPTNIHLAGWFKDTVIPGELGLSIIDGHLDGRTQPGIFATLSRLKVGDSFTVELANNTKRTFQVKSVQSLPVQEATAALFSQVPGLTRQLTLITCGGTYRQTTGYDQRVIVVSQLIK